MDNDHNKPYIHEKDTERSANSKHMEHLSQQQMNHLL